MAYQPQIHRNISPISGAAALAMALNSNQNISKGIGNIGKAFSDYGERKDEEASNEFLSQLSQADSEEAVQNLLASASNGIDTAKLMSFASDKNQLLRSNAERSLKNTVNQNYPDPSVVFSPEQESKMSPFQRSTRNEITAKDFLTGYQSPERGLTAVDRFNNLQAMRSTPEYKHLSQGEQKLVEASFLRQQGNDSSTLKSLAQAEDYDSNRATQSLLNATRSSSNQETQNKKDLLSRLDMKGNVYSPAEYSQLPASGQKTYDRKLAVPVIKQFTNLGDDTESRVRGFLGMTQAEQFQRLSLPQQDIVAKQVMKRNGLSEKVINDTMEFLTDSAPAPKDRPFVPGFMDNWLNNGNEEATQETPVQPQVFVSPEVDTQIISSLNAGATVDQLRSSQLYSNNSDQIEGLLQAIGGK